MIRRMSLQYMRKWRHRRRMAGGAIFPATTRQWRLWNEERLCADDCVCVYGAELGARVGGGGAA